MPSFYGLNVQGEIIIFEAVRRGAGDREIGIVLSYEVSGLRIPQSLETRKEEIRQLIREGLDTFGSFGDRTYVTDVSVEFV